MTGYGQGEVVGAHRRVTVEIRCVNHRYADYNIRLSRDLGRFEDALRRQLQGSIRRGRADVLVTVEEALDEERKVAVNAALARGYVKALQELRDAVGLSEPVRLDHVLRLPDVLSVVETGQDPEELGALIEEACARALGSVVRMREAEGRALAGDLAVRLTALGAVHEAISARAGNLVPLWRQRLQARLSELLAPGVVDQDRLAQETAIFADRADISEELVRLTSHLERMRAAIGSSGIEPVGRKLDFICQEILREVNTIGSKALDSEIGGLVITAKEELERIREQLQNIE
jgi:uncharacterized protein (TIGR00255 family)